MGTGLCFSFRGAEPIMPHAQAAALPQGPMVRNPMPFRRMLPQAGRWTLRAQLYFVLLVLAAFLLAWMGFEIAYNHHEMFDAEQAANRDRARVAAADIEQYLKHSEVMLDRLAQDASVRSLQGLRLRSHLRGLALDRPGFRDHQHHGSRRADPLFHTAARHHQACRRPRDAGTRASTEGPGNRAGGTQHGHREPGRCFILSVARAGR